MGSPEFEMHVFARRGSQDFVDVRCLGAEGGIGQNYDQNGTTWSGEILLADSALVDSTNFTVQMWEDDTDACRPGEGRPPRASEDLAGEIVLTSIYAGFIAYGATVNVGGALFLTGVLVYQLPGWYVFDDLVGIVHIQCYTAETGSVTFTMKDTDDQVKGKVDIDFRGLPREPICDDGSGGNGQSVSISGPDQIRSNQECTWVATIQGGTPPYSYNWLRDGIQVSTQNSYSGQAAEAAFELDLILNGSGFTGHAARTIVTDPGAPPCLEW